ncbi:MAG: SDR family oxidoreductase [Deltaproteobacteria bacterium]|nr:SDR family oxidoreductase [Deltaproteobacteria bacterium]
MGRSLGAAVVSGAGRGLGRVCALALADAGYPVALQARTQAELYDLRADIEALGGRARVVVGDARRPQAAMELVERCQAELGPVSVVVAAAGRCLEGTLLETKPSDWLDLFEINVMSAVHLVRAGAEAMIEHRIRGRIVLIAGVSALRGVRRGAAFSASKHALLGLVRSAALEFAPHGITVNALCPGLVEGQSLERIVEDTMARTGCTHSEARQSVLAMSPMGEAVEAEEIAGFLRLLVSDGARHLTGQALTVDAGQTLA